jgi:hypothetical protein
VISDDTWAVLRLLVESIQSFLIFFNNQITVALVIVFLGSGIEIAALRRNIGSFIASYSIERLKG